MSEPILAAERVGLLYDPDGKLVGIAAKADDKFVVIGLNQRQFQAINDELTAELARGNVK